MPSKSRKDTDGSAISEDFASLAAQARSILRLCYRWSLTSRNSTQLVSISIYPPSPRRNGDFLCVGKAFDGGYRLVTFHRSANPLTALIGLLTKVSDGTAVWKEDTYSSTSGEWLKR